MIEWLPSFGKDGNLEKSPDFDLVIFDCDGVLIDSEVLSCACLSEQLRHEGFRVDLQDVFERFLGRSFSTVEEQYRQATGRPLKPDFGKRYLRTLKLRFERELKPMPGVESTLARLKTRSCVASSSRRERLEFSLAIAGLAQAFGDRVYSADQVARAKPAPDLFLHAAERMGAAPARTLVIEDSVNGIVAGKAAGMTVWGFVGGGHYAGRDASAMLSAAGADRIYRAMEELPPM